MNMNKLIAEESSDAAPDKIVEEDAVVEGTSAPDKEVPEDVEINCEVSISVKTPLSPEKDTSITKPAATRRKS